MDTRMLRRYLRMTLQNWQANKQDKSLKLLYTQAQKAFDQAVRWAIRQFIHQLCPWLLPEQPKIILEEVGCNLHLRS